MSALLNHPDTASSSRVDVPTPVRRIGYVIAAIGNAVVLWASHQLLDWGWPAFLTRDFEAALGLVSASLIAGICVNLALAVHHRGRFRLLADLVTAVFGLVVGLRLLDVFPFDFTGYATDWSGVTRAVLVFGIAVTGIAMVGNLIRLAAGPGD